MPKRKSKVIKEPEQPIAKKRKNETKSKNQSSSTPVVSSRARTRQPKNEVTPPIKSKTLPTRKAAKPISKKKVDVNTIKKNITRKMKVEENNGDSEPSAVIKTTAEEEPLSRTTTSSRTRLSVGKQKKVGSSVVTPVTAHESVDKRTRGLSSKTTTPTAARRSGGKKVQDRPARGTMPVIALQSSDLTSTKKTTSAAAKNKASRSKKSPVPAKAKSKKTSPKKSKSRNSKIQTSNGSNTEVSF